MSIGRKCSFVALTLPTHSPPFPPDGKLDSLYERQESEILFCGGSTKDDFCRPRAEFELGGMRSVCWGECPDPWPSLLCEECDSWKESEATRCSGGSPAQRVVCFPTFGCPLLDLQLSFGAQALHFCLLWLNLSLFLASLLEWRPSSLPRGFVPIGLEIRGAGG